MASTVYARPSPELAAAADDLDNILNYDAAVDDFLKDLPINNDRNANSTTEPSKNIDEEITVKRKRKPVAKLDENLLTSAQGIPRLRRISKDRLKLRGKGHEFSDIGRLLNMYQLWMDDLYPRAKFRDATTMIEKLGHTRRMQVFRRTWLDSTKPGKTAEEVERDIAATLESRQEQSEPEEDIIMSGGLGMDNSERIAAAEQRRTDPTTDAGGDHPSDVPDMDDLDELLAQESGLANAPVSIPQRARGPFEEEEEQMDELDLLLDGELAETIPNSETMARKHSDSVGTPDDPHLAGSSPKNQDESNEGAQKQVSAAHSDVEDFADEEAVLAEMEGLW